MFSKNIRLKSFPKKKYKKKLKKIIKKFFE